MSALSSSQMPETMEQQAGLYTLPLAAKQFYNEFWKFDYLPASQ